MNTFQTAIWLVEGALGPDGGITIDRHGYPVRPQNCWVVGVRPAQSMVTHASRVTTNTVQEWVARVTPTLGPDEGMGSWADNGVLYFDVVRLVRTKAEAERLARAANQKAIYNLLKQQTVTVR